MLRDMNSLSWITTHLLKQMLVMTGVEDELLSDKVVALRESHPTSPSSRAIQSALHAGWRGDPV